MADGLSIKILKHHLSAIFTVSPTNITIFPLSSPDKKIRISH